MHWKGRFNVIEAVGPADYKIEVNNKVKLMNISNKPNQPGMYKNGYRWDSNPCPQRILNIEGSEVTEIPIRGKGVQVSCQTMAFCKFCQQLN